MRHRHWTLVLVSMAIAACGGSSGGGSDDPTRYPGDLPFSQQDGSSIDAPDTRSTYLDPAPSAPGANGPATMRVLLTDAPNPAIESALVTIGEVSVHMTGGAWFSVMSEERELDLLDLQNGVTTLLGEIELDAGKVTQIRMTVTDGEVIADGESYDVEVPSGDIKLNRPFDVCSGGALEVTIDFDAEKSLRYNKGKDLFKLQPVVKIESVTQDCPPEEGDDEDEGEYDGALGWFSMVLPPVDAELFSELTAIVDDIQVHDQGIGQVTTFEETYEADLLEEERTIIDEETDEPLYTVLIPPVEIPAGDLDQLRLFLQSIIATDPDGNSISITLPSSEEGEGDGLKFFGEIPVCEDALTMLMWDLALDEESLDFENQTDVVLHPETHEINLIVTCEPLDEEDAEGDDTANDDDDGGDDPTSDDDDDQPDDDDDQADDDDDDDQANDDDDDDDDQEEEDDQ